MIGMIPLIVAGGVINKFSNSMLGKPKQAKRPVERAKAKGKAKSKRATNFLGGTSPF